jgi:hypothetical protein
MNTAGIDIECRRCNATGQCPEIMREWANLGEKYRNQRRLERKTTRIRAQEIGCTPSDLSKAEDGMIDPKKIYKEGAKCPVCSPEQKCWECADDVSREGAE